MKWIGWIMKHLCYSRYIFLLFIVNITLSASLLQKSALFYYGDKISYSMVGIHDYIVVEPKNTNVYTHGFDVYKHKIFARVIISESFERTKKRIINLLEQGYLGIYLDSDEQSSKSNKLINYFKSIAPKIHFMLRYNTSLKQEFYELFDAIVINDKDEIKRKHRSTITESGIDIIKIHFVASKELNNVDEYIKEIVSQGMIPYVTTRTFHRYGKSSKNAIKREIFTLIDGTGDDRTEQSAHCLGAMPLEYLGYIQKLYDINTGLPDINSMHHYAGVVIWLEKNYKYPAKLITWVLALDKIGIKIVFANSFGFSANTTLLKSLDIDVYNGKSDKKKIIYKDKMMGFEIEPSLGNGTLYLYPNHAKNLLVYQDIDQRKSVPAAITSWGGYAFGEVFLIEIDNEKVWVINPFIFFQEALRLKKLAVPDTTTQNGKRLFFTHVDGDGMVSRVESNPEFFAGKMILEKILKVYEIPHSISLIGAEVFKDGLYPQFSSEALKVARDIYTLDNVEPATHTFTHPFFWGKIHNGKLDEKYRLKPKNYEFSLHKELVGTLGSINELLPKETSKKAQTVFWSGDCAPLLPVLDYIYKEKILNINGGDTTINNVNPWLSLVAPLGLERGEYYQVYTGAQNENIFTNDWLGPFWGFKRVVQTFKLTGSPRRLKPIDIYYHFYSGSKTASLNALTYVFDWSLKQDIFPLFTTEYIPKVMDYFIVSMANEQDKWLISGMRDLKTVRFENLNKNVDIEKAKSVYGFNKFETHTYVSFNGQADHYFELSEKTPEVTYLVSSNAEVQTFNRGKSNIQYKFKGYTNLKLDFYLPKKCSLTSLPEASKKISQKRNIHLEYTRSKEATVNVICR